MPQIKRPLWLNVKAPPIRVPPPEEEPLEHEEPTLDELSTTPGCYHALMPWKWYVRIFWVLLLLGCAVASAYCVTLVIDDYLSYGKDVQLTLDSPDLKFPAVTVCSLNPYSTSAMITNGILEFQALMSFYVKLKQRPDDPPNNFEPSEWPPPRYEAQCDFLDIANADITYSDVTRQPGAIARIFCYSPFILDNSTVTVVCSKNGSWSPYNLPKCTTTCSKLEAVRAYVNYSDPNKVAGSMATVICLGENAVANGASKSLSRSVETICNEDGNWSISPQCFSSCPEVKSLGEFVSVAYYNQDKTHGSTLTISNCTGKEETANYNCNDGSWGKLLSCVKILRTDTCPPLISDNAITTCDNVQQTPSPFDLKIILGDAFSSLSADQLQQIQTALGDQPCGQGQTLDISCNDNATQDFFGSNSATCSYDYGGNPYWKNISDLGYCMAKCQTFAIDSATVTFSTPSGQDETGTLVPHGTVAKISCGDNLLIGSSTLICNDGQWGVQPMCLPQCPPVTDVPDGYVHLYPEWGNTTDKRYAGVVAVYSCYKDTNGKNYVLSNYNTDRICQSNGTWDQPEPYCYIQCPHVVPDHGWVKYNDIRRKNETVAVYGCNGTDWWLIGDYVTDCNTATGKWNYFMGLEPRCVYIPPKIQQFILAMHLEDHSNDSAALDAALDEARRFLVPVISPNALKQIGYQKNDFIRLCTYARKGCTNDDWTELVDPTLGNCFTFNGNLSAGVYKAMNAGSTFGLELVLYTDQQDYMRSTSKAGVAVIIAVQNETVLADVDALQAAMGYQTSFSLVYNRLKKLPLPYNNCTLNGEGTIFYFPTEYSLDGCVDSCLQAMYLNACSCGDPRLPVPNNATTCGVNDRDCINDVATRADNAYLKANCFCPPPCSQSYFDVSISRNEWPSKATIQQRCSVQNELDYGTCASTFRKNYIKINVYYQRMGVVIEEEVPSVTSEILVSNVGSYVGLWLSISTISAFEFISICWQWIHSERKKRRLRHENRKNRGGH